MPGAMGQPRRGLPHMYLLVFCITLLYVLCYPIHLALQLPGAADACAPVDAGIRPSHVRLRPDVHAAAASARALRVAAGRHGGCRGRDGGRRLGELGLKRTYVGEHSVAA